MRKNIFFIAIICILFTGCKKWGGVSEPKEDLSYVIRTYYRYETNGHIIKQTWTYDGYKETGYKSYYDGKLTQERNNYSYDGLKASYDSYSYRDSIIGHQHIECEFLDETFRRAKYLKSYAYYPNPQNNHFYDIRETYYDYDGKKMMGYQTYLNGTLTGEYRYNYEGLRCTHTVTYDFSSYVEVRKYDILYLDDTYLREKSRLQTRERYDTNGDLIRTTTYYSVYDYDGKKPIGYQFYQDGNLGGKGRDYQYDDLTCYYFIDDYQDGEVISTRMYEVEYLE